MKNSQKLVIGIDGGGTKTAGILSDLDGRVLNKAQIGSTNPNKIGYDQAVLNLKTLISVLTKNYSKKSISLVYLGLAGGLERDKMKKEKIKKNLEDFFNFPIIVEGDQKIAFRANSNSKDGVLIIAGTGSIAIGWREKKEAISGGWDWLLGDQGSAFWIGKTAIEKAIKSFDGRENKFLKLQKEIFKYFGIKEASDLYNIFYCQNFVEKIASIAKLVDLLANSKNKESIDILKEAGKELAKMGIAVIKELSFQKEKFSLVFSGKVFKSKIVLNEVKAEIKRNAPKAEFILAKNEPVCGAVKLAIEEIKRAKSI